MLSKIQELVRLLDAAEEAARNRLELAREAQRVAAVAVTELRRQFSDAMDEMDADAEQVCELNEGHACNAACGYCGRCCNCKAPDAATPGGR